MLIETFILGPVQTNTYLIADPGCCDAVVIDPAWDGAMIQAAAVRRGWHIRQLWFTHAHFDHIGGAGDLVKNVQPSPTQALHPADLPLWRAKGGATLFGLRFEAGPEPEIALADKQILQLGELQFEVRHAPGHSPGHVLFYCASEGVMFCGDVIFAGGVGRTDLPGGDYATLIHSIKSQVFSLPDETRLLSGHGEETTVGWEKRWNPFLS